MLIKVKTLKAYKLNSQDGEIGKVNEFYFDDQHWTIRYLVADTGIWLTDRRVLLSPHALTTVNVEEQYIAVDLSKKQIEDSPSLDTDKPVSRQYEQTYYRYYGWPMYWGGPYMWGPYPYIMRNRVIPGDSSETEKTWDSHLRSTNQVSGYHVQTSDGETGHVEDFIIDDGSWAIRYLVIDTRNWWPGKKVLVSPRWIERVSWEEMKVFINLSSADIKQSPEYMEESPLTRDYETELHRYYDRQEYWVEEADTKRHSR